jgi:uncharacterized cupin superfamily protein
MLNPAESMPSVPRAFAGKLNVPAAGLEAWPLPDDAIVAGRPQSMGHIFSKSADGRCVRGIWACTPGAFRWTWTDDETITVVQGRATVAMDDGRRVELAPGDMAVFERGQSSVWTIHEAFRKSFHTIAP